MAKRDKGLNPHSEQPIPVYLKAHRLYCEQARDIAKMLFDLERKVLMFINIKWSLVHAR